MTDEAPSSALQEQLNSLQEDVFDIRRQITKNCLVLSGKDVQILQDETAFDTLRRLAWVNWHVDVPRLHVRRSHAFGKKRLIAEFLQCDEGSHWQKIRSFPCPKATIS